MWKMPYTKRHSLERSTGDATQQRAVRLRVTWEQLEQPPTMIAAALLFQMQVFARAKVADAMAATTRGQRKAQQRQMRHQQLQAASK